MKYAKDHIINWTWYLGYEEVDFDGTIKILLHDRLHLDDDGHPPTTDAFTLIEDGTGDRVVIEAVINGKTFKVTNPKNIFSYDRFQ